MVQTYRRIAGIAFFAAVVVASFAAVTVSSPGDMRALSSALADPLAIFAGRSPGERAAGALSDTKARARRAGPRLTDARPLGRRLTLPYVPENWPSPPDSQGDRSNAAPVAFGSVAPIGIDVPTSAAADSRPTLSDGIGFEGSPSGGFDGGVFTAVYTPPVDAQAAADVPLTSTPVLQEASAVPEPANWSVMIIGFLGIGTVLRHARRRRAALVAVAGG